MQLRLAGTDCDAEHIGALLRGCNRTQPAIPPRDARLSGKVVERTLQIHHFAGVEFFVVPSPGLARSAFSTRIFVGFSARAAITAMAQHLVAPRSGAARCRRRCGPRRPARFPPRSDECLLHAILRQRPAAASSAGTGPSPCRCGVRYRRSNARISPPRAAVTRLASESRGSATGTESLAPAPYCKLRPLHCVAVRVRLC